jgi:hypothetical protein
MMLLSDGIKTKTEILMDQEILKTAADRKAFLEDAEMRGHVVAIAPPPFPCVATHDHDIETKDEDDPNYLLTEEVYTYEVLPMSYKNAVRFMRMYLKTYGTVSVSNSESEKPGSFHRWKDNTPIDDVVNKIFSTLLPSGNVVTDFDIIHPDEAELLHCFTEVTKGKKVMYVPKPTGIYE